MAAPTFVNTGGAPDLGGAWTIANSVSVTTGNVVVFQLVQDGSTNGAVAATSFSGIAALDGTANSMTSIGSFAVGGSTEARQHLWIGRATSTTVSVSGTNSTSEDLFGQFYQFADVSAGTTLATVIENGSAGATTTSAGTSATLSDASVTTLGPDRLACNFIAVNDDNAIALITGQSGGTWADRGGFAASDGTDAANELQTAAMASAGTIDGGTASITDSDAWGVVGFALIGTTASGPTATGALTLPAATVAGTGVQTNTSTGALALPAVTVAGTGDAPYMGTGALTLSAVTVDGDGEETFTSTGALDLAAVTVAGVGVESFDATGALDLPTVVIDGTGEHTEDTGATGSGALTLPAVTLDGTGTETFTATGVVELAPVVIDGTGTAPYMGTGALTLPAVTVDGTGVETFTSTGAVTLEPIVIAGDGVHAEGPEATGAVTLTAPTLDGSGVVTYTGTGALVLGAPTLDGTGILQPSGTGALDLAGLVIAGTGETDVVPEPVVVPGGRRRRPQAPPLITGHGALILAPASLSGQGTHSDNDFRFLMDPELVLAGVL
jgi:hypothetical protein